MSGTPSVSCSYIYRNVPALNYSACSAISAYIDSYDTNTFSDGFKGMELLQWKIHDISMEFLWNQEICNLKVIHKSLFLIKVSADISVTYKFYYKIFLHMPFF